MTEVLAPLSDPDFEALSFQDIVALITPDLVDQMRGLFGLEGVQSDIIHELAKVLLRYQWSSRSALSATTPPQTKELEKLKNAVNRAEIAFKALSVETRSEIDFEILTRDPFNRRFFFPEQVDYWEKNKDSTQLAMNKLAQISHALETLKSKRALNANEPKKTKNSALDNLIGDLTMDFERGSDRRANSACHYDSRSENYVGQYLDFVIFILDRFAPKSYHSRAALGKRIIRLLRHRVH